MRKLHTGSKVGKVWGTTTPIFQSASTEVQSLYAKKGFRCSRHCHTSKSNLFLVISGKLKVTVEKDGLEDEVFLGPGEMTVVSPGLYHEFEALMNSHLIELYWVELNPDDITRKDQGGVSKKPRK